MTFLEESLRVRRQAGSPDDAQTGQILTELAIALRNAGQFAESDRRFRDALNISQRTHDSSSTMLRAQLLVDLGRLELVRSNIDGAQKHFAEALRLMRQVAGPRTPLVA